MSRSIQFLVFAAGAASALLAAESPPESWIEPQTGHRVIRLTREPGASLYFHQNGFTAQGDKLVVTTSRGLSTVDFGTREMRSLVEGQAANAITGKKNRQVFYIHGGSIMDADIDSGRKRVIAELPPEIRSGSGLAINADETLLAGSYVEKRDDLTPEPPSAAASGLERRTGRPNLEQRWAAHLPMRLYTVEIGSGMLRTFHPDTNWLNHVQFSPTDPTLLLFCHEGPWHKVDRIWTVRTDGSSLQKIHTRTMDMEIAGHEFFNPDGRIIWYDLQTPRSKVFWLAGHLLATGQTIRYQLKREEWSVHYNVSPDGKLFAGDGGGPRSVAAPGNGQWIYLFRPKDGQLEAEKLADLSKHDYKLEPNVTFTPDGKWIVFRSNMHGPTHVYAVEVERTAGTGKKSSSAQPAPQAAHRNPPSDPSVQNSSGADRSPSLQFHENANGEFDFDTGILKGKLRAGGKSLGISSLIHKPSGVVLDRSNGIFSHYRVFTAQERYGHGAWDWPSSARLRRDGAVEVRWPAAPGRDFELSAVYQWHDPLTLDLETSVKAERRLPKFEVFLASYFSSGFTNAAVDSSTASGHEFVRLNRAHGDWQLFPRDNSVRPMILDGRWALEPNPITWSIQRPYAAPLAVRRNPIQGLAAVLFAASDDCFAVSAPHETEGHYSIYLSLFGRDIVSGETARARARFVVTTDLSDDAILRQYQAYRGRMAP